MLQKIRDKLWPVGRLARVHMGHVDSSQPANRPELIPDFLYHGATKSISAPSPTPLPHLDGMLPMAGLIPALNSPVPIYARVCCPRTQHNVSNPDRTAYRSIRSRTHCLTIKPPHLQNHSYFFKYTGFKNCVVINFNFKFS